LVLNEGEIRIRDLLLKFPYERNSFRSLLEGEYSRLWVQKLEDGVGIFKERDNGFP